jgi:hypothetical protein
MDDDTMNLHPVNPGNLGGPGRPPRWTGRTKRIVTTAAVGAVLLGSGTAIGVALTGGAAASTSSAAVTAASTVSASPSAGTGSGTGTGTKVRRCTRLVEELIEGGHLKLAQRLHALCTHPLLRLALVGGEHGTVTFNTKSGPRTTVFERGTVESDSGSVITVSAADGTTWSFDISSSTVIREDGHTATVSTGDQVFVAGTVVNGANDAQLIRISSTSSGSTSSGSTGSSTSGS